ncbi:hypothetical protein UlMin_039608 [Ulmus minor]
MTPTSPPDRFAAAPPPDDKINVESDMVVILAALLCALICVVGLIAVTRCAWLRRPTTADDLIRLRQTSLANRGLKKKVVQSLPKFTYKAGAGDVEIGAVAASECAICLGDFVEGEEIRVLPQCGHSFHVACIDTWLGSHSSCPSCRQLLVVASAAAATCHKCGHRSTAAPASQTQLKTSSVQLSGTQIESSSNSISFLP